MRKRFTRRRFLRGALSGGAAVTVGLPLLGVFLNDHGDAFASGAPLPRRFGTWFWGNGMNPWRWNPETEGGDYAIPAELEPVAHLRHDLTVLTGFGVILAGEPNHVHYTGYVGTLTGDAPTGEGKGSPFPTVDVLIADHIGSTTRFRSLEMAATGNPKHSYSQRNQNAGNPAEPTALSLYQRVFGSGFVDPNAVDWSPDPRALLRESVLSAVREDRKRLEADLGAADRARLDEYFTSVRQLEKQLEIQQTKPPPLEACQVPEAPTQPAVTLEISTVIENHRLLAQVLALALACDQTRVFNMVFSNAASILTRSGGDLHHILTHEEPIDPKLGYQIESTKFVIQSMEAWATFVETLKSIPEGDGTLLDNCLVLAHSEHSNANRHSVTGLPIMLAGRGGGRVRTGLHVRGEGEPVSRVGLTVQQAMGLRSGRFGTRQNETSQVVSAVLA